jgi:hypothetical protein
VEILTNPDFYLGLLARIYFLYLTPIGFCLAAIGLFQWRSHRQHLVPDLWLLGVVIFILAVGRGNLDHDYYQIPLLPAAALYFAAAAAPAFDGDTIRLHVWQHRWAPVVLALVLSALALCNFYFSGVVRNNFRRDNLDLRMLETGRAIERAVPAGALVITVEYGVNSPMLLYYAHRRGWSFDVPRINTVTVDRLRRLGARFFATSEWAAVQAVHPELVTYLQRRRQVELAGAPANVAVFDLSAGP